MEATKSTWVQKLWTFIKYCVIIPAVVVGVTAFLIYVNTLYGPGAIFTFLVVTIFAIFGMCVSWLYKDGRLRLSHIIVLWIMLSGTAIMCSTVWLAYIGSAQIAESLAATVASTMIAEAIGYAAGSAAEHVTQNMRGVVPVESDTIDNIVNDVTETVSNSEQITEEADDGSVG
jgi:FtsH-binding integral membrane protein